jgi:ABC-type multidrug transport system fused ATPase/permease subunit
VFRKRSNQPDKLPDFSNLKSIDLIFDLVKGRSALQMDQADKLDTKAYSVMTSATALVSAALILQAVLPALSSSTHISFFNQALQLTPLALLLAAYLAVMITAILAYKLRQYAQTPNPMTLFQNYLDKPELYTKAKVLRSTVEDYKKNEEEINKKIKWNTWAIRVLWVQTILFVVFLFFHAVH